MDNDQDRSATAAADFTIDDDYQTELIAGSRSARAAQAGEAAAAGAGASPQALHPIQLDGSHALERSERFRAGARGYQRNHRTTSTAPYQQMTAQADAYLMDAANLGRAHVSYDGFLPLGQQGLQSILRFQSIQASLGPAFDLDLNDDTALDTPLTGTDQALPGAIRSAGLKRSHRDLDIKATNLTASRHELVGAIQSLEVVATHDIIVALHARLASHEKDRAAIEAKIARVGTIAGGVEKALGYAHGAMGKLSVDNKPTKHPSRRVVEDPNGVDAASERVDQAKEATGPLGEAAETVMEIFYDKQLNEIAVQISSLEHEIEGQEMVEEQAKLRSIQEHFTAARTRYAADVEAYESAIADRRNAYVEAGAAADTAMAGKGPKHDQATQAMLFISAGREARSVLDLAITAGHDASADASTTIAGMAHRSGTFLLDDWTQRDGEGDRAPDQLAVQQANAAVAAWLARAEVEKRRLDRFEQIAQSALYVFGGVKGAY